MKESKELHIPADGNCLYTTVILSYLLSVIDNQRFFRERVKHLSGFNEKFADEFRLKLLAKYHHPTNLHLSLSMQQMIAAFLVKANIKENTWGGVEEIQKIALTFKLKILVYLDNKVIMGDAFTEEYDRYVLENPVPPIVGAMGTIHVLRCRASPSEIPNTKSKAELLAKIASAKDGQFQHYRLLDVTHGITNAIYLGMSALNRFEESADWTLTNNSLVAELMPPVTLPVKIQSQDDSTDDENDTSDGNRESLGDQLLKTVRKTVISDTKLIMRIEEFIKSLKNRDFSKLTAKELGIIERQYRNIDTYLSTPYLVSIGIDSVSIDSMNEQYRPTLLQVATKIHNARVRLHLPTSSQEYFIEKNETESHRIYQAGRQMATLFKQKIAYSALQSGTKFIKAKAFPKTQLSRLKQSNVIRDRSKQNLNNLKVALSEGVKQEKGANQLLPFLRDDEYTIYKALLNLPYQCQHATKFYYPLRRDGRLASYAEIRRQHPGYVSEFSTTGNVSKLGNDGFVFFRVIVPPVNSKKTQYGDTRLLVNLELLEQEGWVSLHEQLVPIPALYGKDRRSEIHFMKDKRILRQAEMVKIHNNTSDSTLQDGIKYTYRTEKLPVKNPFSSGKKDLKTKFTEKNNKCRQFSFVDEIFYGPDIRQGIALSVIQELRFLEDCGYRHLVLTEFRKIRSYEEQHIFLAELIKGFFRVEGKYPVSLQVKCTDRENKVILSTTGRLSSGSQNFLAEVDNPDGDGSVDPDLSINDTDMRIQKLEAYKKTLKEQIRFHGMARGTCKKKNDDEGVEKYTLKIKKKEALYEKAEEELADLRSDELEKLRQELVENFNADPEDARRLSLSKLQIILDGYYDLLSDEIVTFDQLFNCSRMKLDAFMNYFSDALCDETVTLDELMQISEARLEIMAKTGIGDLIGDKLIDLSDIKPLIDEQLEEMGNADLRKALEERGFDFSTLLQLYVESPIKFECATCDDISELALSYAPQIPQEIREYIEEYDDDIDWEFVSNSLGDTDSMLLDVELGYF